MALRRSRGHNRTAKGKFIKITIVAIGSRGDTQPYMALGLGLQAAGHDVRLCAGDNFRDFVTRYGLAFVPSGVDTHVFINQRIPAVLESGRNTLQAIRTVVREGMAFADSMWQGMQRACADADLICTNFIGFGASCIAERRGIPMIMAHTTPLIGFTRSAPSLLFPTRRSLGAPLNGLTHQLGEFALRQFVHQAFNQWRAASGLQPVSRMGWRFDAMPDLSIPMLYAHSPTVLARPADWPPDWHAAGFWFLDAPPDWTPPNALIDFLAAGPPPIYIGFGSMSNRQPAQMTAIIVEALKRSGQRAILATGWGGLAPADRSDQVFVMDEVPHDWLFAQVAAVVHHGGVGTTAAGLRAGVLAVIVPQFGDQYFWGEHARRIGAALRPLPRKQLTADKLAAALQQVTQDADLRRKARAVGAIIRAEDGIGQAVRLIEAHAAQRN